MSNSIFKSKIQEKVHGALMKASQPTRIKHQYQCKIREAYNALKISPYAFAGAISSLHRAGLYCHVLWSTNPDRKGYKDHPKKSIKLNGVSYAMRSDVAIVIDPLFFC